MAVQRLAQTFDMAPGQVIMFAGITAQVRFSPGRPGVLAIRVDAAREYQERLRIVRDDTPPEETGYPSPRDRGEELLGGQGVGGVGQLSESEHLDAAGQPGGIGRLAVRELPVPAAGGSADLWDPEASPDARRQAAEHAANRIGGITVAVPPDCPVLLQECGSVDLTVDGGSLDATVTGSGAIQIRGTQNLVLTVAGGGTALLSGVGGTARIAVSGAAAVELSGRLESLQVVVSDRALVRGRGDFYDVAGAVAGRGRIDLDGHVQRMSVDVFGGGSLSVNGRRVR